MKNSLKIDQKNPWEAQLKLRFAPNKQGDKTYLVHNLHHGPLVVQKALHPENNGCCHVILLHPPAGIAGGDTLSIEVSLEEKSHVLITTPGACKFYGHRGRAEQYLELTVAEDSLLEWVPQETILFDNSYGHNYTQITLAESASFIGWELTLFGREAFGENFSKGEWHNIINIDVGGKTILHDPLHISATSRWFSSPLGLNKQRLMGHCWLRPPPDKRSQIPLFIDNVREKFTEDPNFTITQIDNLLIARHHGNNIRHSFEQFERLRAIARRAWFNLDENYPRIWRT